MNPVLLSAPGPGAPTDDDDMTTEQLVVEASAPIVSASSDARGEALRYLVASIAALALDAALLWIGVNGFGIVPWVVGAVAYLAGLVLIYFLSVLWVFGRRTVESRAGEFAIFAALGVLGLVVNSTTLYVATAAGLALPLAKMLSAAIGFCVNFISRKAVLFNGRGR